MQEVQRVMVLFSTTGDAEDTTAYLNSVGLPPLLEAAIKELGEECKRL